MKKVVGYAIVAMCVFTIAADIANLLIGSPDVGRRIVVFVICVGGMLAGLDLAAGKTKRFLLIIGLTLALMIAAVIVALPLHLPRKVSRPPTVVTVIVACRPSVNRSATLNDSSVATTLAAALNDVPSVTRVEVTSNFERCTAVVRFRRGTELPTALQAVRERLASVTGGLPATDGVPQVHGGDPDSLPRIWVLLKSDHFDLLHTTELARTLVRDQVARLPGVTDVELIGGKDFMPTLWLDPALTTIRGMTCDDARRAVADALRLSDDPSRKPSSSDLKSFVERIVVATRSGPPVLAGDVARFDGEERLTGFAAANGRQTVLLAISTKPDEPTTHAVEEELTRLALKLPLDVHLSLAADLSRDRALLFQFDPAPNTSAQAWSDVRWRITQAMHAASPELSSIAFDKGSYGPFEVLVRRGDDQVDAAALRKSVADLRDISTRVCEIGEGNCSPLVVRVALVGPDPKALREWGDALTAHISSDGAALDATVFPEAGVLGARVAIDQAAATRLGVSMADIDNAFALAFRGVTVSAPDGQAVTIRVSPDYINGRPGSLPYLYVRDAKGQLVPLSALSHYAETNEPLAVFRVGLLPAVRLIASPPPGVTSANATEKCMAAAEMEREKLKLSNEYRAIDLSGPAN